MWFSPVVEAVPSGDDAADIEVENGCGIEIDVGQDAIAVFADLGSPRRIEVPVAVSESCGQWSSTVSQSSAA
jgi:hypothetical protein